MGSADLKNLRRVIQDLHRAGKKVHGKLVQSIVLEAEGIRADAIETYVPVDQSPLKNSIFVDDVKDTGSIIQVSIFAGGPSAPYALAVHEHLSEHSPKSWRQDTEVAFKGTPKAGPKYLERPMRAAVPGMPKRIARRLE